jgi:carbonic anhydrase/acetyltransferase-like protein (isoleucine patch superfamily)
MAIEAFAGAWPVVDPTAFVHRAATVIGEVTLGAESSVWPNVSLRGDVGAITIGPQTSIQDNSVAHTTQGRSVTVIGSRVTVGHGVILHGCRIGDDCIVGMGSIVMDNAVIEPWSILAAGSLVTPDKRYPGGMLLVGRPARPLRAVTDEERAWITRSWENYVQLGRAYRSG